MSKKISPTLPIPLSFNVVPRKIQNKGGKVTVKLAAIVQPLYGLDGGEIIASIKGKKNQFKYSSPLKKFIKNNVLNKSNFKPLENFLAQQITLAKADLSIPLGNLKTFINNGLAPSFTITFQPQEETSTQSEP